MNTFNSLAKKWLFIVAVLVALVAGVIVSSQLMQKPQMEKALIYEPARVLYQVELSDQHGNAFTNASLQGKWSWVFLGYTSCPDVCPTTLQTLAFVYQDLLAVSKDTQVLLVSVDPRRDSTERLNQYINYFNDEFFALRAEHDVLFPFAQNLGLMYALTDSSSPEGYLVDHSASMVLINPEGKIAAIMKPEHEVGQITAIDGDKLVRDFAKIVAMH